jgi:DNA (cytosine-5)-methyltransferase 1
VRDTNVPTHLDLFSGIGGFALAAQWAGFRTVAFVEIDKYCQKILAKNFLADAEQSGKCWRDQRGFGAARCQAEEQQNGSSATNQSGDRSEIRITPDIFDFDGKAYRGCDLITGGFPCQPFSVAGKRRGAADDRALWPEMFRVISEARPAWLLGENVPGIIPMELDNVLSDLESIGYACRSFVIPACAVDARHRRDRLWIVCRKLPDANEQGSQGRNGAGVRECAGEWTTGSGDSLANAERRTEWAGLCESEQTGERRRRSGNGSGESCQWLPEPDVGRVAHGIPCRVDRLKGLGNAIVPRVAYEILREIRELIPCCPR